MSRSLSLSFLRSRWAAVGAAVAVTLGAGGIAISGAATSSPSSITTITPCRIMDTRAATSIGGRATPLGAGATHTINVWGSQGNCTIPNGATGVVMNVTFTNPTEGSFLTVWPSDANRPLASSANWTAGRSPTANQVTTALASDGKLSFYNDSGTVDLIVDIVAYLSPNAPQASPSTKFVSVSTGQLVSYTTSGAKVDVQCSNGPNPVGALVVTNTTNASLHFAAQYDENAPFYIDSTVPNDFRSAQFLPGDHHFTFRLWNAFGSVGFDVFTHIGATCEINVEQHGV